MKQYPSQAKLKELFNYDAEFGELVWKKRADLSNQMNSKIAGKIAGHFQFRKKFNRVEKSIVINKKRYSVKRIIWIFHNGEISKNKIVASKNNEATDTRIQNLIVTENSSVFQCENIDNTQRNFKNGFKGVYKHDKKYKAVIRFNGKPTYIGMFKTQDEAAIAYNKAAMQLHGENAVLNDIPDQLGRGDAF
jgi:hypothetical protein